MSLNIGDTVPDFEQHSTIGRFDLHTRAGDSWVVLFSNPRDFIPVCTTELGAVAALKPEFDSRGIKVVGLSVDPTKRLRLTLTYPASTGRNFSEILRTMDSLPLTARHKIAPSANWQQGDDVIIVPAIDDAAARVLLLDGWQSPLPYLLTVKQPV